MRHNIPAPLIRLSILAVALWCVVLTASAQTTAFSYQGQLNDGGSPANGSYDIQFKLFDSLTAGMQVGSTVSITNVAVSSGIFTVTLDFGASAFPGANRWLEISVRLAGSGAFTTLTPRQQLTSTPYAIKSLSTTTADGLSPACVSCVTSAQIGPGSGNYIQNTTTQQASSSFNISGNGLIGGNVGIGPTLPATRLDAAGTIRSTNQTVPTSGEGLEVIYSDHKGYLTSYNRSGGTYMPLNLDGSTLNLNAISSGNVGIGIQAPMQPTHKLHVKGISGGSSIAFFENGDPDGASALTGYISPGAGGGIAVSGTSDASSGVGVAGYSTGSSGGIGVIGRSISSSGQTSYGVFGTTDSYFSNSAGVYGRGDALGAAGVYGISDQAASYGVIGEVTSNSGSSIAVLGRSSTESWAGYFTGKVHVSGNLSKAAGSFKIDHPLSPETKYLYHSFVESPDMKNIYDGTIMTDAGGFATVTMPEWFDALNSDFRYQLTAIGQFAQAIVAEKLKGNQFKIRTSLPNVEVSWQVTGIRQDAYARKNRIPVEEEKPEAERGSYLHPEVFDKPEELGVEWKLRPEMMRKMKERREKSQQAHEQTEKPTLRQE